MTLPSDARRQLALWFGLGVVFYLAVLALRPLLGLTFIAADLHWDIATQFSRTGVFGYRPGLPSLIRGPTFIAWLIPFAWLADGALWAGVLATTLVRAAGAFVLVRIAGRFAPPLAGWLAGALWFFNPFTVYYDFAIEGESMSGLLLAATVLCALRWQESPIWRRTAVLGVAFGLSCLAKTTLATFLLGYLAVVLLTVLRTAPDRRGRVLRQALFAVLVAAACIAPWTARNYAVSGRPYLVQAHFRSNMVFGHSMAIHGRRENYDLNAYWSTEVDDMYNWAARTHGYAYAAHEPVGEDHIKAAIDPTLRDPAFMAWKVWKTAADLWYLGTTPEKTRSILLIMMPHYLLALLGGLFLWRQSPRGRRFALAIAAGLLAVTVGHGLVIAMFRYFIGASVFIFLLAGLGLAPLLAGLRTRLARRGTVQISP